MISLAELWEVKYVTGEFIRYLPYDPCPITWPTSQPVGCSMRHSCYVRLPFRFYLRPGYLAICTWSDLLDFNATTTSSKNRGGVLARE